MRILMVSDSPTVPGAYAIQTRQLAEWAKTQGHDVLIFGTTYYGERFERNGIPVVGGAARGDLFGDMLVNYYAEKHGADIIITMKDPYIYQGDTLRRLNRPWCPVVPVDTEPLNIATKNQLAYATMPIALTRHAQGMMADEGIRALYAPHAIDTDFWTPGSRKEARAALNVPDDVFMAAFVGQNNSKPSRKSIDQVVIAWYVFLEKHPESVLFLHTSLSAKYGGINVAGMLQGMRLNPTQYRYTDQNDYDTGNMAPQYLRTIYRAADVLLNPSRGGGFELCCVEAQACGTPVIGCDWTAMRETIGAGWRIAMGTGSGETVWSNLGGFRMMPTKRAIVHALGLALEHRNDSDLRNVARNFALRYSTKTVYDTYWQAAFTEIEALLKDGNLEYGQTDLSRADARTVERTGETRPDAPCTELEGHGAMDAG